MNQSLNDSIKKNLNLEAQVEFNREKILNLERRVDQLSALYLRSNYTKEQLMDLSCSKIFKEE